jgi:hypothetical protein
MAGGGSSIPVMGRLGSVGKGRGSGVGSPRVPFVGCWRRRSSRQRCSATPADCGRKELRLRACWPAMLCNRQLGRLQRGCGEVDELLAGCGGTRRQELAVGASMADDDVVCTRGRLAAAFIAWASRLSFKPSRRRRYPGLQCPSTAAGHRWARLAEEVADGPVGPARCVRNGAEHEASRRGTLGRREAAWGRRAWGADAEAVARGRAPARNRFKVPLFDCVFLKIFELKCTE